MERIATPGVSLPCFGLERDMGTAKCQRCPFNKACGKASEWRVPLSRLKFSLIPEKLFNAAAEIEVNSKVANDMWRRIYQRVFKEWPLKSLGPDYRLILDNAKSAKVSLEAFFAAMLMGHKLTKPTAHFFVTQLTCPSSVTLVHKYRKLCTERVAHCDIEALGLVLGENVDGIQDELLHSEILAGSSIIAAKVWRGGAALRSVYSEHELSLSTRWLAIEPTYAEMVLEPYQESRKAPSLQHETHRYQVLQALGEMKRKKTLASTVFSSRQRILPNAIKHVLKLHGREPDDFTHVDEPITSAMNLWLTLGLAVQHYECVKALHGLPHRLWH